MKQEFKRTDFNKAMKTCAEMLSDKTSFCYREGEEELRRSLNNLARLLNSELPEEKRYTQEELGKKVSSLITK
jgi:hypothetical protein